MSGCFDAKEGWKWVNSESITLPLDWKTLWGWSWKFYWLLLDHGGDLYYSDLNDWCINVWKTMGILAELASRWWWAPLISPVNATAQFLWKHLYLLLKVHVVIIYQEIPSFTRTEDNKEKIADKKVQMPCILLSLLLWRHSQNNASKHMLLLDCQNFSRRIFHSTHGFGFPCQLAFFLF